MSRVTSSIHAPNPLDANATPLKCSTPKYLQLMTNVPGGGGVSKIAPWLRTSDLEHKSIQLSSHNLMNTYSSLIINSNSISSGTNLILIINILLGISNVLVPLGEDGMVKKADRERGEENGRPLGRVQTHADPLRAQAGLPW